MSEETKIMNRLLAALIVGSLSLSIPSLACSQEGRGEMVVRKLNVLSAHVPAPVDTTEVWKTVVASLVLPGSGQVVTGRKWGWGLMAAEVALIGGSIWTRSEGRKRQDRYEHYADLHWERERYLDYLDLYQSITDTQWPYSHHTLPPEENRNHDFYEMIGKYDQFAPGWDDWRPSTDTPHQGISVTRHSYLNQRLVANRYLKWSLTAGGLIFLNHVTSGVEVLLWNRRKGSGGGIAPVERSPWRACYRSLLLPGRGQRDQGRRGLASSLVVMEGIFWGGMICCNFYSHWKRDDSYRWAAEHAGVDLMDKEGSYFNSLALYPDWTTYNAAQLSGLGDPSEVYPAGIGYEWRWDSEESWQRYRRMRRDSRLAKNLATLAVGGVIAGRLVGAVSALITGIRDKSNQILSPVGPPGAQAGAVQITLSPWIDHSPGGVCGVRLEWKW